MSQQPGVILNKVTEVGIMVANPFGPVVIPGAPDLGPDPERQEMYDSFERMPAAEQEQFVKEMDDAADG
jgi:hypothetical protein